MENTRCGSVVVIDVPNAHAQLIAYLWDYFRGKNYASFCTIMRMLLAHTVHECGALHCGHGKLNMICKACYFIAMISGTRAP